MNQNASCGEGVGSGGRSRLSYILSCLKFWRNESNGKKIPPIINITTDAWKWLCKRDAFMFVYTCWRRAFTEERSNASVIPTSCE